MEMMITGESISGIEAVNEGWANRAFPADELDERTLEMAQRIAAIPPELVQMNKRLVHRQMDAMGMHEIQVAAVLVGWVPVPALAEAAQVGCEHDVPALCELVRVVTVVRRDRGAAGVVVEPAHFRLARAVPVLRQHRRPR